MDLEPLVKRQANNDFRCQIYNTQHTAGVKSTCEIGKVHLTNANYD